MVIRLEGCSFLRATNRNYMYSLFTSIQTIVALRTYGPDEIHCNTPRLLIISST